ncbi:MAG: winged helix-turn-helix domain-containing protein [Pseudomonadota bacterium]
MQLTIEGWRIDTAARKAERGNRTERLSPRAVRLLQVLVDADGAVVSRGDLLDRIWPNVIVGDDSLTQVVSELRRKLGNRELIGTVARGGYRLVLSAPAITRPLPEPQKASVNALPSLEAHALCLEARDALVRCGPGALQLAETLTAEAVDLAPECAEALTERAFALIRSHLYWSEGRDTIGEALRYAQRAIDIDPNSAAAYSALGYAHSTAGHWEAAETAHRRALFADPKRAVSYNLAAWHLMTRRSMRASIRFFEQVGDLEPLNIKGYLQAAQLSAVCDPVRSRRNCERAMERARARLVNDRGDMRAIVATSLLMALMGEHSSAHAALEAIDTSGSAQGIYLASALAIIGETERAVLCLEELFDHGWRDVDWLFVDPSYATIADDKRFVRMRDSRRAA